MQFLNCEELIVFMADVGTLWVILSEKCLRGTQIFQNMRSSQIELLLFNLPLVRNKLNI